jgi:hypothetical protein
MFDGDEIYNECVGNVVEEEQNENATRSIR